MWMIEKNIERCNIESGELRKKIISMNEALEMNVLRHLNQFIYSISFSFLHIGSILVNEKWYKIEPITTDNVAFEISIMKNV